MNRLLLITGATGALGARLLERYLQDPSAPRLVALIRAPAQADADARLMRLLESFEARIDRSRVTAIPGDICRPRLGLSQSVRGELQREVTGILHCAAMTRFNQPLAVAREVNGRGTRQVLDFARDCPRLEKVGCFSTVYVAGKQTGRIAEEFLTDGAGFINSYEESKSEMEQLVRSAMSELPIALYRSSTLIGDSRDGKVHGFNAVHHAMQLLYRGLAPMVPGRPEALVDLVCSDYVAESAFRLFERHFAAGLIYHLCSGPDGSCTLDALLDESVHALLRYRPAWRRRQIEKPSIVDGDTFELFVRSIVESGNPILVEALRSIETFAYQLLYPKLFLDDNTRAALSETGLAPVPVLDYFPKVVRYCLETRWGVENNEPTSI